MVEMGYQLEEKQSVSASRPGIGCCSTCCAESELGAAHDSRHRNCKQQEEEEAAMVAWPAGAGAGAGHTYDAVVVGSGYGGGVACCRLAQAGLRVAVLERGKAWESSHFPTTFWQLVRNTHLTTPLGSVGNRNSLYQLHFGGIDRSCALVGCGLGGGSLVNAGIVLAAPQATLRHPSWPRQWREREWEAAQARAMAMLEPEAVPNVYPKSRVMDAIAGDIEDSRTHGGAGSGLVHRDALRGSFRFQEGGRGSGPNVAGVRLEPCVGCGNCVTGCTYGAKNSVDKNYLATALQAGAQVHTECEVLYVAPNYGHPAHWREDEAAEAAEAEEAAGAAAGHGHGRSSGRRSRRWRVYLNEVDYVEADFVVLAAGTLGTTQILLRSKEKGLGVSERLGHGFSCNGNHVGLVGGAKAATMGYSLDKKQLADIPMASRTGPCISSSHSSPARRFVVQGGSIPRAYPEILFKTILSNRVSLPDGQGRGHLWVLWREATLTLRGANSNAILLNVMGSDAADGRIQLDRRTGRLALFPPHDPRLSDKMRTCRRLADRLGGLLFMSRFRSTAVHLLGGCNAAADASAGVANHQGLVFAPYSDAVDAAVHSGLYVCDGSLIPCAVGVNPTGTITAASEIVAAHLVRDALRYCCNGRDQQDHHKVVHPAAGPEEKDHDEDVLVKLPAAAAVKSRRPGDGGAEVVVVRETVKGSLSGMPCTLHLLMHMGGEGEESLLRGRVGGRLVIKYVEPRVLHILDGSVDMCWVDARSPYTHYMRYRLLLASSNGARYALDARKIMNPFLFCAPGWQEATTLHATLRQIAPCHRDDQQPGGTSGSSSASSESSWVFVEGKLHVSPLALLRSVGSLRGKNKWKFAACLVRSLARTYFLQLPRAPTVTCSSSMAMAKEEEEEPESVVAVYPACSDHSLTAADGQSISMQQWPSSSAAAPGLGMVVLMLNGYSTESFCLPTEPHDLVRTLLQEGYEPWLLRFRLHPLHACQSFTLDDLAHFDIPAAFARIREVKGAGCRVHVVAHCVGGLAIHMALLGGHLPPSAVASLACTNSAMFFHVTASARAKLVAPLVPLSMAVLGRSTVLAMAEDGDRRHALLRSVARLLPRPERCACDACAVFSGIFGSAFWHGNVTRRAHDWVQRQAVPRLPMAAFPHLRRVCLAGRLVDAAGRDAYMLHPERLALPTTYVSGGRPILVTPRTSERAHLFMRHHHPRFRHHRVVVPGYGHSDLLIGEHAHRDVFPHILAHLRRCCTTAGSGASDSEEGDVSGQQLAPWEHLPPTSGGTGFPPTLLLLLGLLLLLLLCFLGGLW